MASRHKWLFLGTLFEINLSLFLRFWLLSIIPSCSGRYIVWMFQIFLVALLHFRASRWKLFLGPYMYSVQPFRHFVFSFALRINLITFFPWFIASSTYVALLSFIFTHHQFFVCKYRRYNSFNLIYLWFIWS